MTFDLVHLRTSQQKTSNGGDLITTFEFEKWIIPSPTFAIKERHSKKEHEFYFYPLCCQKVKPIEEESKTRLRKRNAKLHKWDRHMQRGGGAIIGRLIDGSKEGPGGRGRCRVLLAVVVNQSKAHSIICFSN